MSTTATSSVNYSIAQQHHAATLSTLINAAFASDKTDQAWLTDTRIDIINPDAITKMISSPDLKFLIATAAPSTTDTETILACCFVARSAPPTTDDNPSTTPNHAHLGFLCVQPHLHKQGLGGKMLAHAEGFMKQEWGVGEMQLNAVSSRLELIRWYEGLGFVKMGKETPFPYDERSEGVLREGLVMVWLSKGL